MVPPAWRYLLFASRMVMVTDRTPKSSLAVPVTVNVMVRTGVLVEGPVTLVVGGWSARPKVSIFLVAGVVSLVTAEEKVCARSAMRRLPAMVSGSDQFAVRAPVLCRVVLMVLAVELQVVRSSWRYWLVSRSWSRSSTRVMLPLGTTAVPFAVHASPVGS